MTFKTKKSLGQNFLKSKEVISLIIETGEVKPGDNILEIGPGEGVLTEELLKKGCRVVAVEKDSRLISDLTNKFFREIESEKIKIVEEDILKFDTSLLPKKFKLIANIPYYITGKILRIFLETENKPSLMTLLVQKEVAERIVAKDGKESLLSISVKVFGEPKYIKTVSRAVFAPQPNVDSAIIKISEISDKKIDVIQNNNFFKILKAGFAHKRKKLSSNLNSIYGKDIINKVFERCRIEFDTRAEDVKLDAWLCLVKELNK